MYNTQSKLVYKNKNDLCSCYVSRANMMQCKHDICVNQNLISVKLESVGWKEKNISQSSNECNYNSPTIIKYKSMISDVPNDEIFLHSEINNHNTTVNNNELMIVNDVKIPNELKVEGVLSEERIF